MNLKVQEDRVEEVLNYIQTNYKIEEILEKYNLMEGCKMSGNSLLIKCPFHVDYDPSMSVNLSKNVYRCFSCGSSGNIVNFLVDYNNKVLDKKCNYFTVMNDLLLSDSKMKLRLGINSIFKKEVFYGKLQRITTGDAH